MRTTGTRDYGVAKAVRARLLGAVVAAVGVVVLLLTVLLAVVDAPAVFVGVVVGALAVLVTLGVVAAAVSVGRSWYVVRLDEIGYRVRFVRGVGRARARWTDVQDVTTAVVAGTPCVVLRLRDGSSSTVPVDLIEGDRDEFVGELRRRLDAGHGYRPL